MCLTTGGVNIFLSHSSYIRFLGGFVRSRSLDRLFVCWNLGFLFLSWSTSVFLFAQHISDPICSSALLTACGDFLELPFTFSWYLHVRGVADLLLIFPEDLFTCILVRLCLFESHDYNTRFSVLVCASFFSFITQHSFPLQMPYSAAYQCSIAGREGVVGELDSTRKADQKPISWEDSDDDLTVHELRSSERLFTKVDGLFEESDLRLDALTALFSGSESDYVESDAEYVHSPNPSTPPAPPADCFSQVYDAPDCPSFPRRTGMKPRNAPQYGPHSVPNPSAAPAAAPVSPDTTGSPNDLPPRWAYDVNAKAPGVTAPWPPYTAPLNQRHRRSSPRSPSRRRSPPHFRVRRDHSRHQSFRSHQRRRCPDRRPPPARQASPPHRCLVNVQFPQGCRNANFIVNTNDSIATIIGYARTEFHLGLAAQVSLSCLNTICDPRSLVSDFPSLFSESPPASLRLNLYSHSPSEPWQPPRRSSPPLLVAFSALLPLSVDVLLVLTAPVSVCNHPRLKLLAILWARRLSRWALAFPHPPKRRSPSPDAEIFEKYCPHKADDVPQEMDLDDDESDVEMHPKERTLAEKAEYAAAQRAHRDSNLDALEADWRLLDSQPEPDAPLLTQKSFPEEITRLLMKGRHFLEMARLIGCSRAAKDARKLYRSAGLSFSSGKDAFFDAVLRYNTRLLNGAVSAPPAPSSSRRGRML